MPLRPKSSIAAQYEDYSIYIMLKSRGALPGFHWGLFIPTSSPAGELWHATNETGGWVVTPTSTNEIPFSMALVLAYKIGSISPSGLGAVKNILDNVPYNISHSPNTNEPFSCRIWVKDALVQLRENGFMLLRDVSEIEEELIDRASDHKESVERGEEDAVVGSF
ncbi:hypothetical protein P170DRAFT_437985 [Aspergillus steynii IBT 23096]|uniref:Uncharacterized protein n=1 Tax=Aspergillus steynii IBT 23096 TaxID=1392250 RepID=A0A2I2G614_9EURO|nr:uncharacterized protein P170DRAFT_437985 [Aspergillus steynii IBT 23096]PLB48317.1 hypothetical protein P170DRAFT_437985 [Aspergillus steynii IBT 23096]